MLPASRTNELVWEFHNTHIIPIFNAGPMRECVNFGARACGYGCVCVCVESVCVCKKILTCTPWTPT